MLQSARYTRDGPSSHREQTVDSAADVLLGSVVRTWDGLSFAQRRSDRQRGTRNAAGRSSRTDGEGGAIERAPGRVTLGRRAMAIERTSGSDLLRCDLGLAAAYEINGFGRGDDASGSEETTRFGGGSGAEGFKAAPGSARLGSLLTMDLIEPPAAHRRPVVSLADFGAFAKTFKRRRRCCGLQSSFTQIERS